MQSILYVLDLDKTLINGDSNDLWYEFLHSRGIIDEAFVQQNDRQMELYAQGMLDMNEYLQFALSAFKTFSLMDAKALMPEFLQTKIAPIVFAQAKEVLSKENVIIISATPSFIVKEVAQFLGIKNAIGMDLEEKNGFLTPHVIEPMSFRQGKVERLKMFLQDKSFSYLVVYTDSINDKFLCEFCDEAFCVNPDPKLLDLARSKGWNILSWN